MIARRPLLIGAGGTLLSTPAFAQRPPETMGRSLRAPTAWESPTTYFNPTNVQISEAFARIALGGDAGTGARAATQLRRFRMPMRATLLGEDSALYFPWVARHIQHLSRLTGQVFVAGQPGNTNLACVLSPEPAAFIRANRPDFAAFLGGDERVTMVLDAIARPHFGLIFPFIAQGRAPEIVFALIVIPTNAAPDLIWAAIVEEFSQVLGLLGDDPRVGWSIFNDYSPYADLTEQDRWLLRVLYQPEIRPGMSYREAMQGAASTMRRLRPRDLAAGPGHPDLDGTDDATVDALMRLAFAFADLDEQPRRLLARWDAPVRARVITDAAHVNFKSLVMEHLAHLSVLTRHAFDVVDDESANLFVAIAGDPEALIAAPEHAPVIRARLGEMEALREALLTQPLESRAGRYLRFKDADRTQPEAALVAVRASNPIRLWHHLVIALSGILGNFGLHEAPMGSAFNRQEPYCDLTPLDQRVMRLLYLSALRPGQTPAEAREAATRAVHLSRIVP